MADLVPPSADLVPPSADLVPPGADLVPPGADWPLDAEPRTVVTGRRRGASEGPAVLPSVPNSVPAGVTQPPDWRSLGATGEVAPPGYRAACGPAAFVIARRDHWGIWACIVAVLGLIQVTFVHVPLLPLLAIALGAAGVRADRLDPPQSAPRMKPSAVGAVVGAVGCVIGVVWTVVTGSLGSIIL